jgi:prepilin-type N-terminal cleavage/methylation domain-containing protein
MMKTSFSTSQTKPRSDGRRRGQRGFTLIEVAMASFILAFAIGSSLTVMMQGFKTIDVARTITLSSQIAQSEIERLRLLNWGGIEALPASAPVDLAASFSAEGAYANRFTVTRVVADVPGMAGEMKDITIIVSWRGTDGLVRDRKYHMRYGKDGLYDFYYTLARA